jgi:hypothetical protein
VSQASVVAGLAVRELWISFRLLLILLAFVGAGAFVALVPAPVTTTLERLSLGLAAAVSVSAAVAGWSIATERATGRAGWLIGRSVGRWTLLVGWFLAVAGVALLGIGISALLGWVTIAGVATRPDLVGYVAVAAAIFAWASAAVAFGILLGALLPALPAALVAALVVGVAGLAAWASTWAPPDTGWFLPSAALGLLATAGDVARGIGPALRSAGAALAIAALVVALARLALERVEL